jgi:hypothetical protein
MESSRGIRGCLSGVGHGSRLYLLGYRHEKRKSCTGSRFLLLHPSSFNVNELSLSSRDARAVSVARMRVHRPWLAHELERRLGLDVIERKTLGLSWGTLRQSKDG